MPEREPNWPDSSETEVPMAHLQQHFKEFHDVIRLDKENAVLREKRDIIRERIKEYLADHELPGFTPFLQGSYAMHVGTRPPSGQEFDIDDGLRFAFREKEYQPSIPRGWIWEAVRGHTEKVERRGPCIRVTYADGYHVDLVVYAYWKDDLGLAHYRLAHRLNGWRPADPPGLVEHVKTVRAPFAGTEDSATKTDQFRRVVRYLKRWNDEQMPGESDNKPSGLALLLFAGENLSPTYDIAHKPDDLPALSTLAWTAASMAGRLTAYKPTPEYEDVFGRLSDGAMEALKDRFRELAQALDSAAAETDPVEACEILAGVLGDLFPVPEASDTARRTVAPAVVTSSSSA